MKELLATIEWSNPAIFGPLLVAIGAIAGQLIKSLFTMLNRHKGDDNTVQQTVTQNASPTINTEASPNQSQSQITQIGLDEKKMSDKFDEVKYAIKQGNDVIVDTIRDKNSQNSTPTHGDPLIDDSSDIKKTIAIEFSEKGQFYLQENQPKFAIRKFTVAAELDPGNFSAHFNLANLLGTFGDVDEAIEEILIAIRISPEFAYAYSALGQMNQKIKNWGRAVEAYTMAIQLGKDDANEYNSLGYSLKMSGDPNKAIGVLKKALEIEPDHDFALGNLACSYVLANNLDEAFMVIEKYIKLAPLNRERVKVTEDFESIRDHPEFIRLTKGNE